MWFMARNKRLLLNWEWPDGREPTAYLRIEVTGLKKRRGLFGLGDTPSRVDWFPDGIRLLGRTLAWEVKDESAPAAGRRLELYLSRTDLPEVVAGDGLRLALCPSTLDAYDYACIGIERANNDIQSLNPPSSS